MLMLVLLLSGCNGGNDNSGGGDDPDTPSVSLSAENAVFPTLTHQQNQVYLTDKIQVHSSDSSVVEQDNYVSNVAPFESRQECEQIEANSDGFTINTGDFVGVCAYTYVAGSYAYPNLTSKAFSLVVSQKQVNGPVARFNPISKTTLVDLPISIDLSVELKDLVPAGYNLSEDVILIGTGSTKVDMANQTITYTPDVDSEAGFVRLIYSYDNGASVIIGEITITVSDSANSAPNAPNIDYSTHGKPKINVGEEVNIDLAPYVSDPDGDAIQLIDVNSWDADVTPANPGDMGNLSFTFSSTLVGPHIVSYVLSDHFGGYASGLVRVEVHDPAEEPPWGNIKTQGKLFWGPMSKSQADAKGVQFTGTHYEKNATVITSVISKAEDQCKPLGRLPTSEEVNHLFELQAGDVGHYNWPIEIGYFAKDGDQVKVVDINNGKVTEANADGQYVTCVTEGEFVVDTSSSDLNAIANGADKAKVVAKVSAGGVPVPNVSVSAQVQGEATLENSEAETDANGLAAFSLVSAVAGKVNVGLSIQNVVGSPSADVQFEPDETTAELSLHTEVDWQEADGGIDKISAMVVDSNNNPIPNIPVKFSSSEDNIVIKPSSTSTGTDGKMDAEVTWTGPVPDEDVNIAVEGTYTTSQGTPLADSTNVNFKGASYDVTSVYQKVQGSTDRAAVVCAHISKDGIDADNVKVQWTSKESWAAPLKSETVSNGLGEACTAYTLLDSTYIDQTDEVTAATGGSSENSTNITFTDVNVPLITLKLVRVGTELEPAEVVAHVVDSNGNPLSNANINWSPSESWVRLSETNSNTDENGDAQIAVYIAGDEHLGESVTIFGETSGYTGSTTFAFQNSNDNGVTIANMAVQVKGDADNPAVICADVFGLETQTPDDYVNDGADAIYNIDWSAAPGDVVHVANSQTIAGVDGHVCNEIILDDANKEYTKVSATVSFRSIASSTLFFMFWEEGDDLGEWIDIYGNHYYQVSVDPNSWLTNDDKDSICSTAGHVAAVDAELDPTVLTVVRPPRWSDIYYEAFTINFWAFQREFRNAGLGKARHHTSNHIDIGLVDAANTLKTVDDVMWGDAWWWYSQEEITRSDFILCH
ncbi:hypothetical protein THZG08_580012 [Vibrio owensii]|uniref:Ig-like domain-containing protein n=1 Tax=Vibrio owensii TaxID=696485 RepID=UPI002894A809|nr:hypothetical protein THZG08_580012 [Vibrio owensii]CAH1586462.1 hypothetical protein THOA03_580012 [Vibrio owensii]